jgi:hypothetical protein
MFVENFEMTSTRTFDRLLALRRGDAVARGSRRDGFDL